MSIVSELEQLQRKKAELKDRLNSIEETEKTLVVRMKVLEERLVIQALERQIQVKLASIEELKSRMNELQSRLGKPQKREGEVTARSTPAISQQSRQAEQPYVQR